MILYLYFVVYTYTKKAQDLVICIIGLLPYAECTNILHMGSLCKGTTFFSYIQKKSDKS